MNIEWNDIFEYINTYIKDRYKYSHEYAALCPLEKNDQIDHMYSSYGILCKNILENSESDLSSSIIPLISQVIRYIEINKKFK